MSTNLAFEQRHLLVGKSLDKPSWRRLRSERVELTGPARIIKDQCSMQNRELCLQNFMQRNRGIGR